MRSRCAVALLALSSLGNKSSGLPDPLYKRLTYSLKISVAEPMCIGSLPGGAINMARSHSVRTAFVSWLTNKIVPPLDLKAVKKRMHFCS